MAEITESEVLAELKAWSADYEAASPAYFNHFAGDVSIFNLSSPTRIDGLDVYRAGFEPFFLKQPRHIQILSPEIRVSGDTGVATFHARVLVRGVATNMRSTVVMRKNVDGRIAITHLHQSPLSDSRPPAAGMDADRSL